MNVSIFKIMGALPTIMSDFNQKFQDNILTIKETIDLIDQALKNIIGLSLDDIGIRIVKTGNKTKIEIHIKNK